jgi:succinoglycan biosynthesis protein ExoM
MENHISVCICTYKRPEMLQRLLFKLKNLNTENKFNYSIVVVDNDKIKSAEKVVESFIYSGNAIEIKYLSVFETNIALVRNTAIKNSKGAYIAFIDDDEFPIENWLINHFNTLNKYGIDGVLGPVLPYFEVKPPRWVVKGKLCERKRFTTGDILLSENTRTGNVLLKKKIFNDEENYFDLNFGSGGEDVDFFRRMIKKGYKFVSCDEAIVYEEVPYNRLKLSYFLKRSFLTGNLSYNYQKKDMTHLIKIKIIAKSLSALLIYITILPFTFIFGIHNLIKYLMKLIYHFSKLLNVLGIFEIKKRNL